MCYALYIMYTGGKYIHDKLDSYIKYPLVDVMMELDFVCDYIQVGNVCQELGFAFDHLLSNLIVLQTLCSSYEFCKNCFACWDV